MRHEVIDGMFMLTSPRNPETTSSCKARVGYGHDDEGNYEVLFSYDTRVAVMEQEYYRVTLYHPVYWSSTTVRHFKTFVEYLQDQCGFDNLMAKLEKIKKQGKFTSWKAFLDQLEHVDCMFSLYKLRRDKFERGI